MEITLWAVVVLYNVDIRETETYRSLLKQTKTDFNILFIDNSTVVNKNENYSQSANLKYISMEGNAGISKAYNKALEFLEDKATHVVWFDDDTHLPMNYIEVLYAALQNTTASVFLPIVISQNKIISPTRAREWKKYFATAADIERNKDQLTAINSGMCVALSIYENYRYDARIFLDYVDHLFMEYIRSQKVRVKILPVQLEQNFSLDTKGESASVKQRFNIFMNDVETAYADRMFQLLFIRLKYGIRISLTQKDPRFLLKALIGAKFKIRS